MNFGMVQSKLSQLKNKEEKETGQRDGREGGRKREMNQRCGTRSNNLTYVVGVQEKEQTSC